MCNCSGPALLVPALLVPALLVLGPAMLVLMLGERLSINFEYDMSDTNNLYLSLFLLPFFICNK
tara:strand:- start:48 stop:239 length:192 start_codon:yes stop_codon:yes gene_type:complete